MVLTIRCFCRGETTQLLTFLRHPRRRVRHAGSAAQQAGRLLWMLVLGISLVLAVMPLSATLVQLAPSVQSVLVFNAWFVFAAIVLAPLIEELLFRAGLRNVAYTLFIGPCLIVLIRFQVSLVAGMFIAVTALIALADYLRRKRHRRPGLVVRRGRAFVRLYPVIFWMYGMAFALIHIANFQSSGWETMLLPLLVLPQLFLGLLLSYIRLRQGLVYSMLLHALSNGFFCLLTFITEYAG